MSNSEFGIRNSEWSGLAAASGNGRPKRPSIPHSAFRIPNLAHGITLIELLVVLTIIAVIGGLVFPSVTAGLDTLRLKSSAERLASTFRFARERALRRQSVCQVTVDPELGRVELFEMAGREGRTENEYRRSWDFPPEITVRQARTRTFVFAPDGGAPQIGLTLANARGRTASVEFDLLSALPLVRVNR